MTSCLFDHHFFHSVAVFDHNIYDHQTWVGDDDGGGGNDGGSTTVLILFAVKNPFSFFLIQFPYKIPCR